MLHADKFSLTGSNIINQHTQCLMKKIKRILEFIIALLNFLFHFKPMPDEEIPTVIAPFPKDSLPPVPPRDQPLFEDIG